MPTVVTSWIVRRRGIALAGLAAIIILAGLLIWAKARHARAVPFAPPGGSIGYVLTDSYWEIPQSPNPKTDCPKGYNIGPRDQFAALFPAGKQHTVIESQLAEETKTWSPTASPDAFPFHEPVGHVSDGFNLDGKVGPNDFTSPAGETGIDNQIFRVLGCIRGFRGPDGAEYVFQRKSILDRPYNRLMIELSDVTNLADDSDVTVRVYRGLDRLLTDASGNKVVPGGSQRIDTRWGRTLIREMKGKIVDGVLTTEPIKDLVIPRMTLEVPTYQLIKDARLRLKLTPTGAEGMIGGYMDLDTFYYQLTRNDSSHHLAQSDISAVSLYKALRRLADAYPDKKTGGNSAISTAMTATFAQVYIIPLTDTQKAALQQSGALPASAGAQ